MYIDKLGNAVGKYNNADYRTIKMKSIDINSSAYNDLMLKVMIKILNLKLAIIIISYNHIKTSFLQKNTNQIGQKSFSLLKILETPYHEYI